MTLDGTNTWVLRDPGSSRSVVVDPGPPDAAHLDAVAAAAGDVAVVLLTHHHLDHSEAARVVRRSGWAAASARSTRRTGWARRGSARGTSSPSATSRCAWSRRPGTPPTRCRSCSPSERAVLTGDTVLGRGTTVVAHPDGELGAYLGSLGRLHALAEAHEIETIWPGHGPVIDRALPVLDHYLVPPQRAPRPGRALPPPRRLPDDADDDLSRRIVEIVYADVDPVLWPARRALRPRPARLPRALSRAPAVVVPPGAGVRARRRG